MGSLFHQAVAWSIDVEGQRSLTIEAKHRVCLEEMRLGTIRVRERGFSPLDFYVYHVPSKTFTWELDVQDLGPYPSWIATERGEVVSLGPGERLQVHITTKDGGFSRCIVDLFFWVEHKSKEPGYPYVAREELHAGMAADLPLRHSLDRGQYRNSISILGTGCDLVYVGHDSEDSRSYFEETCDLAL